MKQYILQAKGRNGVLKGSANIPEPETWGECLDATSEIFGLDDDANIEKKARDIFWAGLKVVARQHEKLHGTPISNVSKKIDARENEIILNLVKDGIFATVEEARNAIKK